MRSRTRSDARRKGDERAATARVGYRRGMTGTDWPTLEELTPRARALLEGAIDIHVHASPDPDAARRLDARALARLARRAGMAGLVLKSHEYPTAPLAWALAGEAAPLTLYGGLSLDHGVGGLNPEAVRVSLRIGAKVVWMPTFDAAQWREYRPASQARTGPALRVLDADGRLLPEVMTILDMISAHDAVLASGHLSVEETLVLLREARLRSIRCVVTHAAFWFPVEAQRTLAAMGAYIEQCAMPSFAEGGDAAFEQVAEQVRAVGVEHVILSTDLGQAQNPAPPIGLGMWADYFVMSGFSEEDVGRMLRENPATLLG